MNQTLTCQNVELLPEILVLGQPGFIRKYEELLSDKFQILKPRESPLPLEEFLSIHAQKTKAVVCSAAFKLKSDILLLLPSLGLVVTTSVGVDHIDLDECRRRGISVAHAADIFSADVADLAVGLLIDVLRKISGANRYVKSGLWPARGKYPLGNKLGGKKVGIVGLGNIGQAVAKRLEAFGCQISYLSKHKKPSVSYTFYASAMELASHCDILVICCALNEKTHHLINKEVLLALGKEGVVVNIARGGIIDEKELVKCLQEGLISGSGLDVFEKEPNVPQELFNLDNVVLSPHFAIFTEESFRNLYKLVSGNLEAYFSNKPLISPLSLS